MQNSILSSQLASCLFTGVMTYRLVLHSIRNHPRLFFPSLSTSSILTGNPLHEFPLRSFSTQQQNSDSLFRLTHKDWLAPNEVLKIFETLKDPNSVISVLDQYSKRRDYKPTEALFTLVINKLALARNFDAIEDIMKRLKLEKPFRFSDDFFYNVIKIYGHSAGRIKKAIDTIFEMPEYGCWPSVKTFNFVLNLLVSGKFFDYVHEIYASAPKLGVAIDACCLNILIKGLCENGKLESAYYVLDEFPKQGCVPNVRTFSTLMHGLCAQGKVEEAFKLLDRMEKEGIEADTVTFNILISGLRKQGKVDEGMQVLERMKQKGCHPSAGSYQEVLYGFLDAQRFLDAKDLMDTMVSEGLSPSFVSYKKLIHCLCDKKLLREVDWAVKQMVQQGFVPKMGMWCQIIQCVFSERSTADCISLEEIVNG
ncbi:hypothetical protein SLE2022_340750 [Rubroshorea leprosula]